MRLAQLAEAEAEHENAATWYDDRSEGRGDEFMDVAREAMALIVDSPETWPLWPKAPARSRRSAVFCCRGFRTRSRIKHSLASSLFSQSCTSNENRSTGLGVHDEHRG